MYKRKKFVLILSIVALLIISISNLNKIKYISEDDNDDVREIDSDIDPLAAGDSVLFDGLTTGYVTGIFEDETHGFGVFPSSTMDWSYLSGNLYHNDFLIPTGWPWPSQMAYEWDVNNSTRTISNYVMDPIFVFPYYAGRHTFAWIFTNVSLYDTVEIGLMGIDPYDHTFNVTDEIVEPTPFGDVDLWVLEDLDTPDGIAYYEKTTGILFGAEFTLISPMPIDKTGNGPSPDDFTIYKWRYGIAGTNAYIPEHVYVPPELSDGSVDPKSGNEYSQFSFTVNYTDEDNEAPSYVNVVINGTSNGMTKLNPSDDDYRDGCIYNYTTTLLPSAHNYNYYFECSDGTDTDSTSIYSDLKVKEAKSVLFDGLYAYYNYSYDSGPIELLKFTWYHDTGNIFNVEVKNSTDDIIASWDVDNTTREMYNFNSVEFPPIIDGSHSFNWIFNDAVLNDIIEIAAFGHSPNDGDRTVSSEGSWPFLDFGTLERWFVFGAVGIYPQMYYYEKSTGILILADMYTTGFIDWEFRLTDTNAKFTLGNLFKPVLSNESLNPKTGYQNTPFTFTVNYTDWDNNAPITINVVVNETSYPMINKYSDDNYMGWIFGGNGCIFEYTGYLDPAAHNYTYYFECNDGAFTNATTSYSNLNVSFSNSDAPLLSSCSVDPKKGDQNAQFNFTAIYTDLDNNAPIYMNVTINGIPYEMYKQDMGDTNYMDGCLYQYVTTMAPAANNYTYCFNCSDVYFSDSSSIYNDLYVYRTIVNGNDGGDGGGGGGGGEEAIPGYNLMIVIAMIGVISIIILKKIMKHK